MTNIVPFTSDLDRAVAEAIGQLVHVNRWGEAVNVTLPLFYPGGSAVCLAITQTRFGYAISDNALAYRETDLIGASTYFSKNVASVTEGMAVWSDTRSLQSEAAPEALAAAMADVAAASSRLAWKVFHKASKKGQAEIADYLFQRLRAVFGEARVEREQTLTGPSTKQWEVDAVVHLDGQQAIFQAVANHHMSVYPAAAMFHDFSLADAPPARVAVVKDKVAMGPFFNILSQSGHVIEGRQEDGVYERAASWLGA
ncbi:hypothetical protein ACMT1E_13035 [Sphingomonas flavalba]|uniref:hypothetical protein n=1 Tax=Sphingomonas flavalba TaxID=2559804 RepID=UPI0039E1CF74